MAQTIKKDESILILVGGLPGSGKSYFATRLAEQLKAEHLNSDQVRNSMDPDLSYSVEDKSKVYQAMEQFTKERLKEGKIVIVDATFYKQSLRNSFLQIAHQHSIQFSFIIVEADESLIRERLSESRTHSDADYEVHKKVKDEFEEITLPHLKLESTNSNIDEMLKIAIQYIKNIP